MGVTEKTAILVISFGTSYEETRKKTIEQIESDLHHAFPEYPLYRAWTCLLYTSPSPRDTR